MLPLGQQELKHQEALTGLAHIFNIICFYEGYTMKLQLSFITLSMLLVGCGGTDSAPKTTTTVSFSIADAPVDNAENVFVAIDAIELVREGQDNIILDVETDLDGTASDLDYVQVDLKLFQGGASAPLLVDKELEPGLYQNLILHVLDESVGDGLSYVIEELGGGQVPMKQPSQKLKLGGFEVTSQGVQRFTIHLDLRTALVQNQNGSRYNLKPHGVTIVDNATVASLSGTVAPELITGCPGGSFVYLYPGHVTKTALLVDNYNADTTITPPPGTIKPDNSTEVTINGEGAYSYAFGFIPAGNYTVAFTCSGAGDDPAQYQELITIPNPNEQRYDVVLSNDVDTELPLVVLPIPL
jgi:hypothetical protein